MTIAYDVKTPAAVLDYEIDWTPFLVPGDTIATSTWTPVHLVDGSPDIGITVTNTSFNPTSATVWLAGGVVGDPTHTVLNRITTSEGRTDQQILYIDIFEK